MINALMKKYNSYLANFKILTNNYRHKHIVKKIYKYYSGKNDVFALSIQLKTKFLGFTILEYPNDMWFMQEILTRVIPDYIIETGTFRGGSALYYASLLENINPKGKIITVDTDPQIHKSFHEIKTLPHLYKRANYLFDKYITSIKASSIDEKLVTSFKKKTKNKKVLVTLDSCHAYEHVLKELELYAPLVSKGSYLVVFDTCVDKIAEAVRKKQKKEVYSLVLTQDYKKIGGPGKAVKEFLLKNKDFQIDPMEKRFFETHLPSGYLKKIN